MIAKTKLKQDKLLEWLIPKRDIPINDIIDYDPSINDDNYTHTMPLDEQFIAINEKLKEVKSGLDNIPSKEFVILMYTLDPYSTLKNALKEECNMQVMTNAGLKMYELIVHYKLACNGRPLHAFCNAELPGSFISIINHYVKTMCPHTHFEWVGSSYLPPNSDSTLLGDTYGFYEKNRRNWIMGENADGEWISGDVTDENTVKALISEVRKHFRNGADLYTSDAGIDVSSDYNNQEVMTMVINYGQILTGLLALAPGGSFVTKQYTFMTKFNRSVIAIVASLFGEFYVSKPMTSRPANSEIYLVGKNFQGISPQLAAKLLAAINAGDISLLKRDSPIMLEIDAILLKITHELFEVQNINFLKEAVAVYGHYKGRMHHLRADLQPFIQKTQCEWTMNNPIKRIDNKNHLKSLKS